MGLKARVALEVPEPLNSSRVTSPRKAGHLVTSTISLPGHGRMCTVFCGVGALAFTKMQRQPAQECHTTEKCLSAWPGPRAASPLITGSANMSSSWGRSGTCFLDGRGSLQYHLTGSCELGLEEIELQGLAFRDKDAEEGERMVLAVSHPKGSRSLKAQA